MADALMDVVEELEAIQACYPEPEAVTFTPLELEAMQLARLAAESSSSSAWRRYLGCTVALPGGGPHHPAMRVHLDIPPTYPATAPAVTIDGAAALQERVRRFVELQEGAPCLLGALEFVREACEQQAFASKARDRGTNEGETFASAVPGPQVTSILRRAIWFHHIKALTKRKAILDLAGEYGLQGWSKPGFPGVILVQGPSEGVEAYTADLHRMRWQAMSVRFEEKIECLCNRGLAGGEPPVCPCMRAQLPNPLRETLGEEMSWLADACRAADLVHVLHAVLKIG